MENRRYGTFTSGGGQAPPSDPQGCIGALRSCCLTVPSFPIPSAPNSEVHPNCNADLRDGEKYVRTELRSDPFH